MLKCMLAIAGHLISPVLPQIPTLPSNYSAMTALEKQEFLWKEKIVRTQYQSIPAPFSLDPRPMMGAAASLMNLRPNFDHRSDVEPFARMKIPHTEGSVAMVEFAGNSQSNFSGLFRANTVPGLARISLGGPTWFAGNIPGMALKLFLPGDVPSANLLVMNSVNGQGENTNPFAKPFSNVIPAPEGFIAFMALRFRMTVVTPNVLSVAAFATVDVDGNTVTKPNTPYQVIFEPALENSSISESSPNDLRADLSNIPIGTVLYNIYARAFPDADLDFTGTLKTTSKFVASKFGDQELFFQHASDTLRPYGF